MLFLDAFRTVLLLGSLASQTHFPRVGGRGRKCGALPATPTNTGKRVWLARLTVRRARKSPQIVRVIEKMPTSVFTRSCTSHHKLDTQIPYCTHTARSPNSTSISTRRYTVQTFYRSPTPEEPHLLLSPQRSPTYFSHPRGAPPTALTPEEPYCSHPRGASPTALTRHANFMPA